jgi:hypothetical protein
VLCSVLGTYAELPIPKVQKCLRCYISLVLLPGWLAFEHAAACAAAAPAAEQGIDAIAAHICLLFLTYRLLFTLPCPAAAAATAAARVAALQLPSVFGFVSPMITYFGLNITNWWIVFDIIVGAALIFIYMLLCAFHRKVLAPSKH